MNSTTRSTRPENNPHTLPVQQIALVDGDMPAIRRPVTAKMPFSRLTDGERHPVTVRYASKG